jgi:hypothetical protein
MNIRLGERLIAVRNLAISPAVMIYGSQIEDGRIEQRAPSRRAADEAGAIR